MNFRRLGETGIECSVIGLGTGRLASVSGGISRNAAAELIGVAQESGINLIDTADSYGQGECEKIICRALQGRRDKFIISTKAGYGFSSLGGGLKFLKPLAKRVLKALKGGRKLAGNVRTSVSRQDFRPETIRNSVEASLRRLGTDYLDIFLLHTPPVTKMDDASLFEMLRGLKQAGKIRHFGVSSHDAAVMEKAPGIKGLSIVQTPINPLKSGNQQAWKKLQAAGIGVVANQIFLSGKISGIAAPSDDEAREISIVKPKLESLASRKGISLNDLMIKYALGRPGVATVLTGTTKPEHLKQNVTAALASGDFSADEIAAIETGN
jgi:aryl-alcohol dehydrogenase-like predicted oxidoreductase